MVAVNAPHPSSSPVIAATGYQPKVSFDTLENPQASMFSYTLHVQSEGYSRTRSTRVFLSAASPDESGTHALEWCLESLVQDGDELVVFRGIDPDDFGASERSIPHCSRVLCVDEFPYDPWASRKRPRSVPRRRA